MPNYEDVPPDIENLKTGNTYKIDQLAAECILADKVYSQCQKHISYKRIIIPRPKDYALNNVFFHRASVLAGTLVLNPLIDQQHYKQVKFEVAIPYTATFTNTFGNIIKQDFTLPNITVNTVLYLPVTRSEKSLDIMINTHCSLITIDNTNAIISVDVILIISAVAKVQLLVPSAGFCKDICDCEQFIPQQDTTCSDFMHESKTAFPANFYPKDQC